MRLCIGLSPYLTYMSIQQAKEAQAVQVVHTEDVQDAREVQNIYRIWQRPVEILVMYSTVKFPPSLGVSISLCLGHL